MMFTAPVPYMQGLGTNDRVLVRVMVSRCEVDMVQIKKTFYQKYHKTLGSFIKVCDASKRYWCTLVLDVNMRGNLKFLLHGSC